MLNSRRACFSLADHVKDGHTAKIKRIAYIEQVLNFIFVIQLLDIPADGVTPIRYLLMEPIGVAAFGVETQTARIICNYVAA